MTPFTIRVFCGMAPVEFGQAWTETGSPTIFLWGLGTSLEKSRSWRGCWISSWPKWQFRFFNFNRGGNVTNTPTKLVNLDWPWKYEKWAGAIILVSDEQFTRLANFPEEAVEKPAPWDEKPISLNDYCRQLAESGATKIHIAYDYFFGGSTRGLYPDTPEFQDNLKKMHDVARGYGLGIEPSVLSPLSRWKRASWVVWRQRIFVIPLPERSLSHVTRRSTKSSPSRLWRPESIV